MMHLIGLIGLCEMKRLNREAKGKRIWKIESVPRQVLVIFPTCVSICQLGLVEVLGARNLQSIMFSENIKVMMMAVESPSLLFGKHLQPDS